MIPGVDLHPVRGPDVALDVKMAYAQALSRADLLPDTFRGRPGNVLLAVEWAAMLGVHPLTAVQHVHVIGGRLGVSAELMRAMVRQAGHRIRVTSTPTEATVEVRTVDDPDHATAVTYSLDDAERAGALDVWWEQWTTGEGRKRKETWTSPAGLPSTVEGLRGLDPPGWVLAQGLDGARRHDNWWRHPAAMLVARATSAAVRAACPEVLMGIAAIEDQPDAGPLAAGDPSEAPEGPLEPPEAIGVGSGADQGQIDEIGRLADRLSADQHRAAREWRERRGIDWQDLSAEEADDVIVYLTDLLDDVRSLPASPTPES